MDPDDIIGLVIPTLVVVGIGAAIGAGVYLVQAARRGQQLALPTHTLFRMYLALMSVLGCCFWLGERPTCSTPGHPACWAGTSATTLSTLAGST